jgi:hypothetical protein
MPCAQRTHCHHVCVSPLLLLLHNCVCVLTKQREVEKRDRSFVPCPQTPTNQKQKRKSESPPVCAPVFLIARVCFHRGPRRGWRTHMCIEPVSFFIRQNEPSTLVTPVFQRNRRVVSVVFAEKCSQPIIEARITQRCE